MTKNIRRILKLFDVEVPKTPLYNEPIYDIADYVKRSTLGEKD